MAEKDDASNFKDRFDPDQYLFQCYKYKPGTPHNYYRDKRLKFVHDFFHTSLPSRRDSGKDFKVLDYGSGPVLAYAISAAGSNAVSEIVLAEYTESSRNCLCKWLDGDALAFDWSAYFKYIVQDLEKKPESETKIREERLRSIAKVACCDIKAASIIENGFEGPYDVVMSFLAIESGCDSEVEYVKLVKEFSKLVKPEGHVLLFAKSAKTSRSICYNVGGKPFHYFAISEQILRSSLESAGFVNLQCTHVPMINTVYGLSSSDIAQLESHPCTNNEFYYMFVTAEKSVSS